MNDTVASVGEEVAESEFERFAAAWRIKTSNPRWSSEDQESFDELKNRILDAMVDKSVVVKEDGNLEYTLQFPSGDLTKLTFKRPSGLAYLAADKGKKDQDVHKTVHMIANIAGTTTPLISNLDGVDFKFCLAVTNLFLGS